VPSTVFTALLCLFSPKKVSRLETTRIYNGKTMPNDLEISSKKLHIIRTAIGLFTAYGFHTAGVDLIEIKVVYPQAYRMAVEYRKWLTREIFELIFSLEMSVLKPDADMVLNLIDGLMFEFLSTDSVENRDMAMDCFFKPICLK